MAEAKWYIVHAYSNFEQKVADAIRSEAEAKGLSHLFEEILVPTHEVLEVRRGKKQTVQKRNFPGYVLVKMVMTDDAYHLVNETQKVTGFLGHGKKPMPISEKEVARFFDAKEQQGETERARPLIHFQIGERVKLMDGPFQSFEGQVEEIDEDNMRLKLSVSIFGRATPVELDYDQVEKIGD